MSDSAEAEGAAETSHPLHNTWCIWEHEASKNSKDWGSNMKNLGSFNTVEEFWRYYNHVPRPSQVRRSSIRDRNLKNRVRASFD